MIEFILGAAAGAVATVSSQKVYSWVVAAKAKAASVAANAASSAINTVITDIEKKL